MVQWLECISIVANSILMKKYEAITIIFIRVDSLTRETFVLEIILGRCLFIIHNYQPITDHRKPRQFSEDFFYWWEVGRGHFLP